MDSSEYKTQKQLKIHKLGEIFKVPANGRGGKPQKAALNIFDQIDLALQHKNVLQQSVLKIKFCLNSFYKDCDISENNFNYFDAHIGANILKKSAKSDTILKAEKQLETYLKSFYLQTRKNQMNYEYKCSSAEDKKKSFKFYKT